MKNTEKILEFFETVHAVQSTFTPSLLQKPFSVVVSMLYSELTFTWCVI